MISIYMEVSRDKYELPVFIAETVKDLAKITGCSEGNIYSSISKRKHNGIKTRFVKVDIQEDPDEK